MQTDETLSLLCVGQYESFWLNFLDVEIHLESKLSKLCWLEGGDTTEYREHPATHFVLLKTLSYTNLSIKFEGKYIF